MPSSHHAPLSCFSTFPESETDGSELKYTLSNKFSAQLLALVKEHPYLYDARDERYKDAQLANNTWREIARKLGLKHRKWLAD